MIGIILDSLALTKAYPAKITIPDYQEYCQV